MTFPQIHKFAIGFWKNSNRRFLINSSMATEKRVRLDSSPSPSGLVILNRHIPSGIISDIISRLPLEDIIRCSSVSTDFYQIIKDLHCSNHSHNTKSQVLDILLSKTSDLSLDFLLSKPGYLGSDHVGVDDSLHMISSNSKSIDGKSKHFEIPHQNELTGSVISSCNGLLCLAHQMGSPYAIYNPITKEKMMLPQLELHPQCDKPYAIRSGFGYDPINNKYKVVVAYDYKCYVDDGGFMLEVTGDIITVGESSWRRLEFPKEVKGRIDTYRPAVFINGAFHWLNGMQHDYYENRGKETYQLDGILTLDINTEKFKFTKFLAFLDLDVTRLRVLNSGKSLVLAGEKMGASWVIRGNSDPVPTQVWKLLGTKPDGSCLYQYMVLNVGERIKRLLTNELCLTLVGALDNGNFLFNASEYGLRDDGSLDHLVLYETEKNECSILEVSAEVPKRWVATIFQPSLVSPPCLRELSK